MATHFGTNRSELEQLRCGDQEDSSFASMPAIPMLPDLDEAGRRHYFRKCDVLARLCVIDAILPAFDAMSYEGCSMLVHAERYLADRLSYELAPWPKGLIRLETEQDYVLPQRAEYTAVGSP